MITKRDAGYALPVMLLGVAIIGPSGWALLQAPSSHRLDKAMAIHQQLKRERRRLIAYSVDYANLYGAGGAGPGHLPCPDTDSDANRPGPNPPCSESVSRGRLPDGVLRPNGRITFAETFQSRSTYQVASAVVNNPSQIINTTSWPPPTDLSRFESGYALLSQDNKWHQTITPSDLKGPVQRWVLAWVVEQLLNGPLSHCEKSTSPSIGVAECSPIDSGSSLVARFNECPPSNTPCLLSGLGLIDLLVGPDSVEWQAVPIERHWFVANEWSLMTELSLDKDCIDVTMNSLCHLLVVTQEQPLSLALRPVP